MVACSSLVRWSMRTRWATDSTDSTSVATGLLWFRWPQQWLTTEEIIICTYMYVRTETKLNLWLVFGASSTQPQGALQHCYNYIDQRFVEILKDILYSTSLFITVFPTTKMNNETQKQGALFFSTGVLKLHLTRTFVISEMHFEINCTFFHFCNRLCQLRVLDI